MPLPPTQLRVGARPTYRAPLRLGRSGERFDPVDLPQNPLQLPFSFFIESNLNPPPLPRKPDLPHQPLDAFAFEVVEVIEQLKPRCLFHPPGVFDFKNLAASLHEIHFDEGVYEQLSSGQARIGGLMKEGS